MKLFNEYFRSLTTTSEVHMTEQTIKQAVGIQHFDGNVMTKLSGAMSDADLKKAISMGMKITGTDSKMLSSGMFSSKDGAKTEFYHSSAYDLYKTVVKSGTVGKVGTYKQFAVFLGGKMSWEKGKYRVTQQISNDEYLVDVMNSSGRVTSQAKVTRNKGIEWL